MSRDKEILNIAIPSIIANVTTPLLGMVDLAIVGHLGDASFTAAIALGGTIFSMIYWIFGFLRMGTSGITAQAYGAGDRRERDTTLLRALAVAATFGIILIMLQTPLRQMMLYFFGGDAVATSLASEYFGVLIYGAPATLGIYALNGWFIGMQNSRLTMWTSLIINLVNIAASLILVYVAGLGIKGVAGGTLIAQWTGFGAALLMCLPYKVKFRGFKSILQADRMRRFFAVNRDIFLRTVCLVAVTVWFTRAGARQGNTILAVNTLLMQLFLLFSYIIDGFAFAGEAIVGKLVGRNGPAAREERRKTIRALFRHGTVISLIFTAAYVLFGDKILYLLSDDISVAAASKEYLWWAVTIPFAGFGAFIWDGIFVGETRTHGMLIAMASAMAMFFATYFILFPYLGNHALWLSFILYLAVRAIAQTFLHNRSR